ncbi:uncharacterized membrane protein YgdD (TMEM256/DUF423 family) [Mesonia algae]|uniref:Uncharacterized membrane protein YgdD (TMEM256/DUF423 family) n=1 Tax=Mesonia algae TaxID=213248 RepID=A0A2W7IIF9_9FLAO|nr:DUF423 domain-containing protein [Mesonia algae]PZW37779.1 uncharacterized membrane protein YgdD (TMEM256/DUF423 family) [Mesonia algae]
MIKEITLIVATLYGGLAIILGAFGAHALKKIFTPEQIASFETGVKYQMYHAIVLLIIGTQLPLVNSIEVVMVWLFIIGTLLFSFSIYGLSISSAKGNKIKILGPITPLGGLLLVAGWVCLLIYFISYGKLI